MGLAENYIHLCKTVRVSFKNCGYDLRPRAGAGLWLAPLIPGALVLGTVKQMLRGGDKLSHAYFASTVVGCGLLVTTILYIMRFLPRGHRIENFFFGIPAISTLLVLLFTQNVYSHNFHDYDKSNLWFRKNCGLSRTAHIFTGFILSLLGGLLSSYGVLSGLPSLLTMAPSCFTIGEAVIVVHALVLLIFSSAVNISHLAFSSVSLLDEIEISYDVATTILQIGMLSILIMLAAMYMLPFLREPPQVFIVLMSATLFIVISLHLLLGGSPILWMTVMVTRDYATFHVFSWWILLSFLGLFFVYHQVQTVGRKATTAQRKVFHILAVFVFASGIVWIPDILYVASGVCFALFLVLEAARLYAVPPLADILRGGFILYGDEKDILFALTPLYLLAGLAAPLWLTPLGNIPIPPSQLLPYLSGILTVGVGDTAASYIGSKYGRRKWKGSNRTVEGTIACFSSQAVLIVLGVLFDFLPGDFLFLVRAFGATAITSFIEAKTSQVDNIVLPLVFYLLTY